MAESLSHWRLAEPGGFAPGMGMARIAKLCHLGEARWGWELGWAGVPACGVSGGRLVLT